MITILKILGIVVLMIIGIFVITASMLIDDVMDDYHDNK